VQSARERGLAWEPVSVLAWELASARERELAWKPVSARA